MTAADILVLGAGPAGLAAAACLQRSGWRPLVIERAAQVGAAWRNHYDRLHLHTVKALSALPGLPYPAEAPNYVPRAQVVSYLETYAAHHKLDVALGDGVRQVVPAGAGWRVVTESGAQHEAAQVVFATGANRVPEWPPFAGAGEFKGRLLHSRDYRNAQPFAGQRVLVVGIGNTGAEIALDLAEQGIAVALAVRSAVNIVRRDVLGRPTQKTAIALGALPRPLGDSLSRLLRDLTVGDLRPLGLQTSKVAPLASLRDHGRTPMIDIGTLAALRRGAIGVRPGIEHFTSAGVRFTDGREEAFDSVVLATGWRAGLAELLPQTALDLDGHGLPRTMHGSGPAAGLHFIGFDIRQPGGLLRTIARQAETLAGDLAADLVTQRTT